MFNLTVGKRQTFWKNSYYFGPYIFYWLSRDGGVWKCVMIALPQQGHLSISFDNVQPANNKAITLPLGALQAKSIDKNHSNSHHQVAEDCLLPSKLIQTET